MRARIRGHPHAARRAPNIVPPPGIPVQNNPGAPNNRVGKIFPDDFKIPSVRDQADIRSLSLRSTYV